MVDWGRAQGRAGTWPAPGHAVPWTPRIPDVVGWLAQRLAPWLAAEVAPGRLMPWLPVAFGTGIVLYFSAEREPAWWAGVAVATALAVATILARRRPIAFPLLLGLAAVAAGFATATVRTLALTHPILGAAAYSVSLSGFVETREEREKTDRIVIRVRTIEAQRIDVLPDRVRLSIKKGTAPPVGSYVSLKARLSPPLQPLRPGGYDFARDMYFHGIGASGFANGAIKIEAPPEPPGLGIRFATLVEGIRDAIDARIRAVSSRGMPDRSPRRCSPAASRDALTTQFFNDAMFISGLGHVLSISGYHMAVVAGIVFFVVRGLLALVAPLALRRPIKKWAAFAALVAATLYLVLSGAEVADATVLPS